MKPLEAANQFFKQRVGTMFKVYGVTIEVAKKKAEEKIKRMEKWQNPEAADEYEALLKSISEDCFNDMKPVAIDKPFDAPQFAQELIDLAKKQHVAGVCTFAYMLPRQMARVVLL